MSFHVELSLFFSICLQIAIRSAIVCDHMETTSAIVCDPAIAITDDRRR